MLTEIGHGICQSFYVAGGQEFGAQRRCGLDTFDGTADSDSKANLVNADLSDSTPRGRSMDDDMLWVAMRS